MTSPCIAEVRRSAIQQLKDRWLEQSESAVDWLLCDLLDLNRPEIQLAATAPFPEDRISEWEEYIQRAKRQEPIQHIIGRTPFRNLELICDSRALIPRPETEQLIDWILSHYVNRSDLEVLDLATGSGCMALSLATELNHPTVTGAELSDLALAQAKENHQLNAADLDITWVGSNLFESLPDQRYDLIVSNPPYISLADWEALPAPVQEFEPTMALTDQQDGLRIISKIITESPAHLKNKGWLYLEIGEEQEEDVRSMFEHSVFVDVEFRQDYAGRIRMVRAMKAT